MNLLVSVVNFEYNRLNWVKSKSEGMVIIDLNKIT